MPKIEITRSTGRLPQQSGVGRIGEVAGPSGAGMLAQAAGGMIQAFAGEKIEEAKMARDSTFVASQTTAAMKRAFELENEVKAEFSGDPTGYADAYYKRLQEEKNVLLQGATSDRAAAALSENIDGLNTKALMNGMQYEREAFVASQTVQFTETLNTNLAFLAEGKIDFDMANTIAQESLDAAGTFMDEKTRQAATAEYKENAIKTYALKLANDGDAQGAIDFLGEQRHDAILGADGRATLESYVAMIEEKNNSKLDKEKADVSRKTENIINSLAMDGEYPAAYSQIDQAITGGVFEKGSETHKRLLSYVDQTREKGVVVQRARDTVESALRGERTINPSDPKQSEVFQNYWDSTFTGGFLNADPQQQKEMMSVMNTVGSMPESLIKSLSASVTNGGTEEKSRAMQALIQLNSVKGGLITRGVDEDVIDKAIRTSYIADGFDGDWNAAIEMIDSNDNRSRGNGEVEAAKQMGVSFLSKDKQMKNLSKHFGTDLTPELINEAKVLMGENMAANSWTTPEAEFEVVKNRLDKSWKTVEFFGKKKVMKNGFGAYGKENELTLGGERKDWGNKQLEEKLGKAVDFAVEQKMQSEGLTKADAKALKKTMLNGIDIVYTKEGGADRYMPFYKDNRGVSQWFEDPSTGLPMTVEINRREESGVKAMERTIMRQNTADMVREDIVKSINTINEQGVESIEPRTLEMLKTNPEALKAMRPNSDAGKRLKKALEKLNTATKVGFKRADYSEKLVSEAQAEVKAIQEELGIISDIPDAPISGEDEMSSIFSKPSVPPQTIAAAANVGNLARQAEIGGNEHMQYRVHVPNQKGKVIGKSGVTVGIGFDLGQRSAAEVQDVLSKAGVPQATIDDLKAFAGVKGQAALDAMKKSPINGVDVLTKKQSNDLFAVLFEKPLAKTDGVISQIKGIDQNPVGKALLREALSSAMYQMDLTTTFPTAMSHLKSGDYRAAAESFVYKSRTNKAKGISKWAQQTPERILPIIEALEELSGEELKSIIISANGVDTRRLA